MHIKHPKLEKPQLEGLAKRELAFLGTPCSRIEKVFDQLEDLLRSTYRIIRVDADHKDKVDGLEMRSEERILMASPFTEEQWFEDKLLGQYQDLALVNGNHYPAEHQVIFLDSEKEGSLRRRLEQISDVLAYVKVDVDGFDWLEMDPDVPVYSLEQLDELGKSIWKWLGKDIPRLRALILAGGKSKRMGYDKSQIDYHGQPQEVYMARLCEELDIPAFISKRDHDGDDIEGFPVVKDTFLGLGPYGAILTAFKENRNEALLVLACDLPNIDVGQIRNLIDHRSQRYFMTALKARSKSFAEPLAAIYEPRMYPRMLHALGLGYNCPTKLLRNTDILSVEVDDEVVININTQEELKDIKS